MTSNLLKVISNRKLSMSILSIFCVLGMFLSMSSNKIFIMWLGLELKMFSVMPLMNLSSSNKKVMFFSPREINCSFYYFFVQVLGSMLFAWGSMLSGWYLMSFMGLAMKLGVSPFFWWVPSLMSRLDWLSMGMVSTMQKMPGLVLFRFLFDLELESCALISLMGVFASGIGMNMSQNKMKKALAWSSMGNMSMLLILMVLNLQLGVMFYLLYSLVVVMLCLSNLLLKEGMVSSSFLNSKKNSTFTMKSAIFLMLSGLPPLMGFVMKVFFLSSFYLNDSCLMIMDMNLKGKSISYFYLLGSFLKSWNMMTLYIFGILLQSMGYFKVFINLMTVNKNRMMKMYKSKMNEPFMFLITFLLMFSGLFIWL